MSLGEEILPFPAARAELVPPVSQVRGTWIAASYRGLGQQGLKDAYLAKLDPKYASIVANAAYENWLPVDVLVAHYARRARPCSCRRSSLRRWEPKPLGSRRGASWEWWPSSQAPLTSPRGRCCPICSGCGSRARRRRTLGHEARPEGGADRGRRFPRVPLSLLPHRDARRAHRHDRDVLYEGARHRAPRVDGHVGRGEDRAGPDAQASSCCRRQASRTGAIARGSSVMIASAPTSRRRVASAGSFTVQ